VGDPDVDPPIGHIQIVQLECLRSGIWGPKASGDVCYPTSTEDCSSTIRWASPSGYLACAFSNTRFHVTG
jgi:hypothetical protein